MSSPGARIDPGLHRRRDPGNGGGVRAATAPWDALSRSITRLPLAVVIRKGGPCT
jgi:hypothetical protein